jgi:HlyD family secretion protein/epimerase transport system membrane fusion protein
MTIASLLARLKDQFIAEDKDQDWDSDIDQAPGAPGKDAAPGNEKTESSVHYIQSRLNSAFDENKDPKSEPGTPGDPVTPGTQISKASPTLPAPSGARQNTPSDGPADLKAMIHKEERAGTIALCAFLAFVIAWSTLAPISSAAIAPGVISPVGSRKTVQHLEGGIIDRILVQDGSEVKVGDPLILLEDTMARASYQLIRTQYYTRAAQQARLIALQAGADHIVFPDWLLAKARDRETFEILASQRNLLVTQQRAHADRKAVLAKRMEQLEKEIEGLNAQIEGQTRQLSLIQKEIKGVEHLVKKGLERTPRLLSLQRAEAEIGATRGANYALISKTEQAIGQTKLELIAADTTLQNEVAEQLSSVQSELAAAGERMAASEDILNRIQISAPVSGKVVELKFHTPGGIIGPGQAILDILPEDEDLIIEARVSPMDIDVVSQGLEAQVHLSALAQRNLPQITGIVRHVSADRLVDPVTGMPYFKTTVEISHETLAALGDDIVLTSGMPAEVMIVTGEETLLGYLFEPIKDTLRRSFREG